MGNVGWKSLQDMRNGMPVVFPLKAWLNHKEWVYCLGEDGKYSILNYVTGESKTFDSLQDAPGEHRAYLALVR